MATIEPGKSLTNREIETTARRLRNAERIGDLVSQISLERRLLTLIGVPVPDLRRF